MPCKEVTASLRRSTAMFFALVLLSAVTAFATGPEEIVLHSFTYGTGDGFNPAGSLIQDAQGNLYGLTQTGGVHNFGTVFKLTPTSSGWTETVLYSFAGGTNDGETPVGSLVFARDGNLYGTTFVGGAFGNGTVFKLAPTSTGTWTETVLHNFHYDGVTNFDGLDPNGDLIFDRKGNLYGTTPFGGAVASCAFGGPSSGCGTVFELSPASGGTWAESILYNFQGTTDGAAPGTGLAFDKVGNLYGTTSYGGGLNCTFGSTGCGTVFELSPAGSGIWTKKILYSFTGGNDGYLPSGKLVFDKAGNLYGATTDFRWEGGAVFQLSPTSGGTWIETTLASFQTPTYGYGPSAVIFDSAGNLYGGTANGSGPKTGLFSPRSSQNQAPPIPFGPGTIFRLSPGQGGSWMLQYLYSFPVNGANGSVPLGPLLFGKSGALYGATLGGGSQGSGTVFELIP